MEIRIFKGILSYTGLLLLVIGIKVFVFELYAIPTPSMERTILPGDKILVSKLKFGPRLPASPLEIPWINLFFYFNKAYAADAKTIDWGHHRLEGYGTIDQGDIVVFNRPELDQVFVKRCIGLPGDTIQIINGSIYLNNQFFEEPPFTTMPYRVMVSTSSDLQSFFEEHKIQGQWVSPNRFNAQLTSHQVSELSTHPDVFQILPETAEKDYFNYSFPYKDDHYWTRWSVDNYGPYVIPYEGMTIELTPKTFNHYQLLINKREGLEQELKANEGTYFLGDQELSHYTFRNDFYFMIGDNRHDSNDSRYWGPVQDDLIIGTTSTLLFSNSSTDGFRWDRFIKQME